MRKFFIVTNKSKDRDLLVTKKIIDHIILKGGVYKRYLMARKGHDAPMEVDEDTDCILIIGGDGTFLAVANRLAGNRIPLLGINMGTLGFLADVNPDEVCSVIDELFDDKFKVEERFMLEAKVLRQGEEIASYIGLNDIVIARGGFTRLIALAVTINGTLMDRYQADGIIICTSTGSTGYNLSAGGPIISTSSKSFAITPICAHSIAGRSIVLSEDDIIQIEVENIRDKIYEAANISYDGREGINLLPGDQIIIEKADLYTPVIRRNRVSFVKILKEKLL